MKHLMLFESFFHRGAIDPTALQLVKIGGANNPALGFLKKNDINVLTEAGIETTIVGEITPKDNYAFWDVDGILSDPYYVAFSHPGRENSLMAKEKNFDIFPGKIYHRKKGGWTKESVHDYIDTLNMSNLRDKLHAVKKT
jgi:hypothetical protein